ncbi:iron-siderophore ABC transporter substrate-binding protein [Cohnella cellulosilytica]|uniref:Iron-siderophore ABC transporter substrate-binding protein n=1 Tax=Cohnella cellulosilytica TaxID=986710 RepID=A0ABW2FNB3_9BACL
MRTANRLSVILVLLLLTALAAACGEKANDAAPASESAPAAESAPASQPAESGPYPRTITDYKNKSVELKTEPQRIAVTDYVIFSHLVSLDYYPMAANMYDSYISIMESMKSRLQGKSIENLGEWDAINLEKTASLEPDLILSSTSDADKAYEQLEAIAPVLFYDPVKMGNTETDWKWGVRELAKVIAQEEKAEQVIADTERTMAEKKAEFAAHEGKTVAFFLYSKARGGFTMQSYTALKAYYEGLGLTPALRNEAVETISMEGLVDLDPDYIFIFETNGSVAQELEEMKGDKVWNGLKAVKNDQVFFANFSMAVMSPVNLLYGIDVIDKALNR